MPRPPGSLGVRWLQQSRQIHQVVPRIRRPQGDCLGQMDARIAECAVFETVVSAAKIHRSHAPPDGLLTESLTDFRINFDNVLDSGQRYRIFTRSQRGEAACTLAGVLPV